MPANPKYTGKASSIPAGLAWGALVSMLFTIAASAVLAKFIDMEKLPWETVGYPVGGLLAVSSFAGAMTAYRKIRRQRLVVCLAAGAVYFALLLAMTALFFGGQYEAVGVGGGLVLAGSAAAALPASLGKNPGRGTKLRIANR